MCVELDHAGRPRRLVDHEVCTSRARGPLAPITRAYSMPMSTAEALRERVRPLIRPCTRPRQSGSASAKTTREALHLRQKCHIGSERGETRLQMKLSSTRWRARQLMQSGAKRSRHDGNVGLETLTKLTCGAQRRSLCASSCRLRHGFLQISSLACPQAPLRGQESKIEVSQLQHEP
jgi:hypothetical protein